MSARHDVSHQGTQRLQMYFQLTKQVKSTTIKNWGGPWARMHMEAAKAKQELQQHELQGEFRLPYSAVSYCMKEGNFWQINEVEHGKQGQRSDISGLKEAVDQGKTYDEVC